jgi:hypothetical protein
VGHQLLAISEHQELTITILNIFNGGQMAIRPIAVKNA